MKILLATDYFMPGLGYESGLAEAYMALGHDVLFSASRRVPSEKSGLDTGDDNSKIRNSLHFVFRFGSRHLLIPGIAFDVVRFRPGIVHAHTFFDLTSVMLAVLKPIFRYKLVYSCHASHLNTNTKSSIWRRMAYVVWRNTGGRLIRALADEVHAVGENEQTMTAWALGRAISEIPIVRLGADLSIFSGQKIDREEIRRNLGFDEQDVVLVHVGTLAKRKEVELLVSATKALRERGFSVRSLMVGGGDADYIYSVKRAIESQNSQSFVKLVDRFESRETIASYYAMADIAVWPAEISIATIEATASGLPLVLKTDDAYRDFLVSGNNGLLYSAGDTNELINRIAQLVDDKDLRQRMGANGREFAVREFEWNSIANSLLSRMA